MKHQNRIKKIPNSISTTEVCSELTIENNFNHPNIQKNDKFVEFNDRKIRKLKIR